jgi:site-specific recombinase XerD
MRKADMKQIDDLDDLGALLASWLDSGRRSSPHTKEAYRRDVRDFVAYTKKPITETTASELVEYQAYLRNKAGSTATEYRKLTALRSFFKHLKLIKVLTEDLAAVIQTPKVESNFKDKALSVDEVKAVIDAVDASPSDALFLRLLYVTGARISELLALTMRNFRAAEDEDGQGGAYVHILGKGKKNREVYIGVTDISKLGDH